MNLNLHGMTEITQVLECIIDERGSERAGGISRVIYPVKKLKTFDDCSTATTLTALGTKTVPHFSISGELRSW